MEERHDAQKSLIKRTYACSCKIEILSFQGPGPGGTTSGTETTVRRPQWSEKGQGRRSHERTEKTHTYGIPQRSIREAREPSHLVQKKVEEEGWRYLQMSTVQQASKRSWREEKLSQDRSDGSEPKGSTDQSKTALKSPQRMVGT